MTKNKLRICLKALARILLAPVAWPVLGVAFSYLGLVGALAITSIFMPDMVGFLEKP